MKQKFLALPLTIITLALTGYSSNKASNSGYRTLPLKAKYSKTRTINNFNDYVQFLKQKAAGAGAGVSNKTLNAQQFIQYNSRAVELDQQQAARRRDPSLPPPLPPNPNGVTNYLNKVLNQNKVSQATDRWYEFNTQLTNISQKYGVQKEYIIALWEMESSFGNHQGDFDVLSVLATLASAAWFLGWSNGANPVYAISLFKLCCRW